MIASRQLFYLRRGDELLKWLLYGVGLLLDSHSLLFPLLFFRLTYSQASPGRL